MATSCQSPVGAGSSVAVTMTVPAGGFGSRPSSAPKPGAPASTPVSIPFASNPALNPTKIVGVVRPPITQVAQRPSDTISGAAWSTSVRVARNAKGYCSVPASIGPGTATASTMATSAPTPTADTARRRPTRCGDAVTPATSRPANNTMAAVGAEPRVRYTPKPSSDGVVAMAASMASSADAATKR